jgi:hypothetical protein
MNFLFIDCDKPSVREPRVNRGRLRHCDGLQIPKATGLQTGKAGTRFEPEVRIPVWFARHGPALRDQLLRQEKDEASPAVSARRDSLSAFILRFAGV